MGRDIKEKENRYGFIAVKQYDRFQKYVDNLL